jgi:hypothetical protein
VKTLLTALLLVAPATLGQCSPPVMCPREIVKDFLSRDVAGVLLRSTKDDPIFNRKTQSRFFLRYDDPLPKQPAVWVISPNYSVDDVSIQSGHAQVYFGFLPFGQIDAMARWHPPDPGIMKYAEIFHLTLSDKRSETEEGGKIVTHIVNPPQWLITDPPGVYVSVEAAIRYITKLRQQTDDPAVQKNAAATLAALEKLKEQ